MSSINDTNRNARIRSRKLRNGNLRTETSRRDSGIAAAVTTTKSGRTGLSVTSENGLVTRMNGREARTLFRLLANHYDYAAKSFDPLA
jgi:hypothetical protein